MLEALVLVPLPFVKAELLPLDLARIWLFVKAPLGDCGCHALVPGGNGGGTSLLVWTISLPLVVPAVPGLD